MTSPADAPINCREAAPLLPLFFDGELDARQMRAVALHGTRCPTCESELRNLEKLQSVIAKNIRERVEEIDFAAFWNGIENHLPTRRPSPFENIRTWWSELDWQPRLAIPAAAAAALAGGLLALFLFSKSQQPGQTGAPVVATLDAPALIDSIDSDSESVAVVSDPDNGTTVLWVSDESPVSGPGPGAQE